MVQQAGDPTEQGVTPGAAAETGSQPQAASLPTGGDAQPSDGVDVEVFSKAEMEEYANAKHSTLRKQLNEQGRWLGLGRIAAEDLEAAKARLAQLEEQLGAADEERAKTDPDVFDVVQARRDLDEREGRLKQQQRQHEMTALEHYELIETGKRWKQLEQAAQVAQEFKVDVNELLTHQFATVEQMRAYAEGRAASPGPGQPTPKPDSGIGAGGINWRDLTPEEKIRYGIEHRR